ncbi:MAG: endonuclease domain-containing protein [Beijerinckiaceae bacterium]|nr:endonuclease domain-containing protein [Beijerinckiaceae bacterium]
MPFERDKTKVASAAARRNAPTLRKALTVPEKRLWMLLRQRLPLEQTQFRRQMAFGSYVVDFVCLRSRIVIEVDGEQHGTDAAQRYDLARTNWLEAQGFRVVRFTNAQVMTEADMVIDTIHAALTLGDEPGRSPPHPYPLPARGRGRATAINAPPGPSAPPHKPFRHRSSTAKVLERSAWPGQARA